MSRELHIVGFQVARETYGVAITSLQEIVRVPEITAVPDAPDYMEGVINLRGKIVSVIDLRKRFGGKETAPSRRNRILVVEHKGRLCGLIVDSASEVLKIPASDIDVSTEVFNESGLNSVTGLGKYKGRLIVLLDINKLLDFSGQRQKNQTSESDGGKGPKAETRAAATGAL